VLVLDTSVLLAAIDREDPQHGPPAELLGSTSEMLVVPVPVLTELDHLLGRRDKTDLWMAFVGDVAGGAYVLHPTDADDLALAARFQARYRDLGIGFVDAAVFLTCVALGETKVATLDRRHFSALRTEDGQALEIVPA
jgi:predicted nucleic acid-binding protein